MSGADRSEDVDRITTPRLPAAADSQGRPAAERRRGRARSPGGQASMSADLAPARRPLSFRRVVDVPFETCLAALDPLHRTGQEGELRFGYSLLHGPIEHDHASGTCRIQVRLARGPLRPLLRMRLDLDRWSSSSTAVELIPGERVRPTAAYFRAGHLLLDSLTRVLPQCSPAVHAPDSASQPHMPIGSGRP